MLSLRKSFSPPAPLPAAGVAAGAGLAALLGMLIARRRIVRDRVRGLAHRVQTIGLRPPELDDQTLADKVMSEVFADPKLPKGSINVNAEYGVVVLRGEARTPQMIKKIESRVRAVQGVRDVRNLLHLPKTPARANAGSRKTAPQ